MKKDVYTRVLQLSLVLFFLSPVIAVAMPGKSYYHHSAERIFWFMVISDIHIGACLLYTSDAADEVVPV